MAQLNDLIPINLVMQYWRLKVKLEYACVYVCMYIYIYIHIEREI